MSKGIDVSHNATVIDWGKVKAAGIDFAMIRCGYGQALDRKWAEYVKSAMTAGLAIGVWYFAYPLNVADAVKEANHAVSLVKGLGIKPPIYYDYEYDSDNYAAKKGVKMTVELRTAMHKAFCDRVKALGYTPGIYTNGDYILGRLDWTQLRDNLLWLAQWPLGADKCISFANVQPAAVNVKYGVPAIWQIGKARIDGITGDVDINYGYTSLPSNPPKPATVTVQPFKPGDRVTVTKSTVVAGVKRGVLYGGTKTFAIYRDVYDVISVSGKRVVIGIGKAVTAAVNADVLKKI